MHFGRQTPHRTRPATGPSPPAHSIPKSGWLRKWETAKKLRAGQEIEALEQQPQNADRDPMGCDYYDPLFFQYRNQYGSNRDRDHAKGEAGPPLAPKPVSVVQRRLNNPCCDEIRRTYGGNQAANNQQQKIGAGHVGESRSEQAERENLVKNNVGSRAKRVSSAPSETPTFLQTSTFLQKPAPLQKASVEQIWSSWRYEKQAPTIVNRRTPFSRHQG